MCDYIEIIKGLVRGNIEIIKALAGGLTAGGLVAAGIEVIFRTNIPRTGYMLILSGVSYFVLQIIERRQ